MTQAQSHVPLRVRLADRSWRQLQERASHKPATIGGYADMVFRYALHGKLQAPQRVQSMELEEEIYFGVDIPIATRARLAQGSHQQQVSLASFSGSLLDGFLQRFDHDPRDLGMVHYLSSRLDVTPVLSESDLRVGIERCEGNSGVRVPQGYMARWLHGRLSALVGTVQRGETHMKLTVELVEELLGKKP